MAYLVLAQPKEPAEKLLLGFRRLDFPILSRAFNSLISLDWPISLNGGVTGAQRIEIQLLIVAIWTQDCSFGQLPA